MRKKTSDFLEIQNKIIELAVVWEGAFVAGQNKAANKYNSSINKIANNIKKDRGLGKLIFPPLFSHPVASVRLFAAVHALDQNIDIQEAENTLRQVAASNTIRLVPLMAEINLDKWENKKRIKNASTK